VTGSTHDEWGVRHTSDPDVHRKLVTRLVEKVRVNVDKLTVYEEFGVENADVGVVAFGSVARSALEARRILRSRGLNLGVIVLKTLWPLSERPIKALAERTGIIVVPELNLGQLSYDVERIVGAENVRRLNKIGGGLPIKPSEIAGVALEVR